MAAKHHHRIALSEPLAKFVERQVAQGHCASADEMVGADLCLLIERAEAGAPLAEEDRSHG